MDAWRASSAIAPSVETRTLSLAQKAIWMIAAGVSGERPATVNFCDVFDIVDAHENDQGVDFAECLPVDSIVMFRCLMARLRWRPTRPSRGG